MNEAYDAPHLEVGFLINTGSSEDQVDSLVTTMDRAEKSITHQASLIERAGSGMMKLDGPTAEVTAFGSASTRALENVRKEKLALERSGERLVAQLEREAATFGMTRAEIKAMDAATKAARLNDLGLTELSGRLIAANDNMDRLRQSTGQTAQVGQFARHHTQNLAFQFQDLGIQMAAAAGSSNPLKMGLMALMQQGAQIQGIMSQAGVGVGGLAKHIGSLALRFAPLGIAAGVAYGALTVLTSSLEDRAGLDEYAKGLGLTAKEMEKLGPVSITTGDVIKGTWRAIGADKTFDDLMVRAKGLWVDFRDTAVVVVKTAGAALFGGMSAAYHGTIDTWRQWPAAIGDVVYRGVNATISGINWLARSANQLMGVELFGQIKALENPYAGAGKAVASSYADAFQREYKAKFAAFGRVGDEIIKASRERLGAKAAEIIGERTGSKDKAAKRVADEAKKTKEAVQREVEAIKLGVFDIPVKFELGDLATDLDTAVFDPFSRVLDRIAQEASATANSMDRAFGRVGSSIGDVVSILGNYGVEQDRIDRTNLTSSERARQSTNLRLRSMSALTSTAKGFFGENSKGYQAMMLAEKGLAAVQLVRTAIDVAGGAARMFATMGPAAFPAVGAMLAVMAGLGFAGNGGGSRTAPTTNTGTGTVLGDSSAQSESVRRAIDALKDVDVLMLGASREMAGYLKSIESRIGGVASLVTRAGDVNADAFVTTGFKKDFIGSLLSGIPLIGSFLGGLFGSKTEIVGGGLYGRPQTVGSILSNGYDADYYTDTKRTKKFLGITTGTSYSTQYSAADSSLETQFTLILRDFNAAIGAAAGPLGVATADIRNRLDSFVVDIGRIDLRGLTGTEIQERLSAVFGAAADRMASAAVPGLERFTRVGEGMFETLVRVSSTAEAVTASLNQLGAAQRSLALDAKIGLAGQFDSLSAMTSAVSAYANAFYSKEERAAAQAVQMREALASLGLVMPATLAGFRALVDAQDLASAAGQKTYATLIQMAPAFAELQAALAGAKSAADVLAERQDLERKLLELRGDTAAIREMDLAKLDASNRALQQQVWAVQAAQEAAKAADELRKAWSDVGTTIQDEVRRIRGLSGATEAVSFAGLQAQFNAALIGGQTDIEVAKSLPTLSQALLKAAEASATSRQEYDRVAAQTAASLEAFAMKAAQDRALQAFADAAATTAAVGGSGSGITEMSGTLEQLRDEVAALRREQAASLSQVVTNTGKTARKLDDVTAQSGGDAISTIAAA